MPRRRRLAPVLAFVLLGAASVGEAAALSSDYPHTSHGNRGVNVKSLQHLLRARGSTIGVDGVFGDTTRSAVQRFQRRSTLLVTGAVDRSTWSRLVVPLASGATGEAVRALQRQLVIDQRLEGPGRTPLAVLVLHVQVHEVVPVPAVYGENDENEEICGENERFGRRHAVKNRLNTRVDYRT